MLAIVREKYGSPDVLELRDINTPPVADTDVLVRIRAASVNALDWHFLRGEPYLVRLSEGLRRPKSQVLGRDMAGTVEAVGRSVTQFAPGDEVFGAPAGSFAEYVTAPERSLAKKPPRLSFEQAAAIPIAGFTALQALRDKADVQSGQRVLVNGASGGVGTFAVQIAKALGADVTGVCSTRNMDIARSIGADQVIDYTREDFAQSEQRFDVVLDVAANRSLRDCRRVLAANGAFVLIGAPKGNWMGPLVKPITVMAISRFSDQRLLPFLARSTRDDLEVLKELVERGSLMPVIDRTYTLANTADAIRYVEAGHARGKVIVTM